MRSLFDVNVLIALMDTGHVNHNHAWDWLRANIEHGWATCPLTQNGCLRIMSQPGYPNTLPMKEIAKRLSEATQTRYHEFWPDSLSILSDKWLNWRLLLGPKQVTDVYLLALAVANGGRFVSFDRRVSVESVVGATEENFCLI